MGESTRSSGRVGRKKTLIRVGMEKITFCDGVRNALSMLFNKTRRSREKTNNIAHNDTKSTNGRKIAALSIKEIKLK